MRDPKPLDYRVHQWQKSAEGVIGKSTAIGKRKPETPEDGMVWAKPYVQESASGVSSRPSYTLFQVVKNTNYNPYTDLTVEDQGYRGRFRETEYSLQRALPWHDRHPIANGTDDRARGRRRNPCRLCGPSADGQAGHTGRDCRGRFVSGFGRVRLYDRSSTCH